ncbi:tRNA (5-methylaminomethyl-2-thiouridine)(34)-methyltransferase MnmD [Ciceribacter sp. L1K23]|uniref:tRNA (5-methylaminomethyl-2-thiouridine)(34)-methyltransferase MnmD n=1 Tax=Ciceribacter sp. L1K23 TaxID=2820276 RepID=UPI001B82C353|nr:tRNA (5-methylaminomethyl-2-thiouridine)(34)-methyltransferase MnmD [Ciceribacter sp. L1K23]MBR0554711.1 tRNA (5-methylaminomethyl-2-thiouridine)(34)-methyltransferase MnmD [Ciceribacter sp. L1K23]
MTVSNPDPEDGSDGEALTWHDGDMPYSTAFGDHFYCRSDGRLECSHVFLTGNGLPARWQKDGTFRIGELGFGTGLNMCETWRQWKQTRRTGGLLHFMSFELYPMRAADIDRALSRWSEIDEERLRLVSQWPDRPEGIIDIQIDDQTTLTVTCGEALDGVSVTDFPFDAWYLDGFAPSRNGAMWSEEIMRALFDRTVPGGTFATYAAAGFVRRNLVSAGFAVERWPGFAGKREMLRGEKPASAA